VKLLAVDGGGTTTVALLCDEDGSVLGAGSGGPSNLSFVSAVEARAAIDAALDGVLGEGNQAATDVAYASCGGPVDRDLMAGIVTARLPHGRCSVHSEADCSLASADGATWGAVVLAGTGSFEFARNRFGWVHRVDGWGALIGDEGSAYAIAVEGLRAVARAEDGRGPATALRRAILDHLGCETMRQVSRRIYGERMARHEIARLAPLVTGAAAEDEVARSIVTVAAERLAAGVLACLRATDMLTDEFPLVLSGGVFRAGAVIQAPLLCAVRREAPRAMWLRPRFEPVYGALRLAFIEAALPWTAGCEARFDASVEALAAAVPVRAG
jgi:N-acetylglucosamine kinase-like BadF-type ATPase